MRYNELRKNPIDQSVPLTDMQVTHVFDDRHTVIEIHTAKHMGSVVAGYRVYIGEEREEVEPRTTNGVFMSERDAKLFYTAYIIDKYTSHLQPEIREILKLYEWELRQYSLFDD